MANTPGFKLVPDWPQLPQNIELGKVSAVATDYHGRIYVGHRSEHPILVFESDGTFIHSMGEDGILPRRGVVYGEYLGQFPFLVFNAKPPCTSILYEETLRFLHGLHIDPWDNLWVTDVGQSIVLAYDSEGNLIHKLGTPDQPGESENQFNQPTDVAVNRFGEIFVSDGYINNRIVKFSKEGKFIKAWGREGRNPGEFRTPHTLTIDKADRLYVSDRFNQRIQIFDFDGRFIEEWTDIGLSGSGSDTMDGLRWGPDNRLYGSTGCGNKVVIFDCDGKILDTWGNAMSTHEELLNNTKRPPGEFNALHWICLDNEENLYTAEPHGMRVQKFKKVVF